MGVMAFQTTSLTIVYLTIYQAQIKNIKAPRHWPLCAEFTGDRWIPPQMASNVENTSIWWHHHGLSQCQVINTLGYESNLQGLKCKENLAEDKNTESFTCYEHDEYNSISVS